MANALLSTVNAARQRLPMCNECERSLPNQIVFDKIESIIRLMQDEQNGLPVKTAKSFMSKIPSVFTGTDLIQWMMRNLKLEDQQEAVHLANLIASHGYIFPIEDHTLSIKNDCTFYRFQTPCLWPSNNSDPENTDYAVYLCKRTMQGKTRLELADYEAENLARLQKMFSRKWEFIFMQAESQAKVDKKRDKLERKVLDSQERAFWDVYRPVPGCVNTTELDIKKACRLSKSAKRCGECQKVAAAGQSSSPGSSSAVQVSSAQTVTAAAPVLAPATTSANKSQSPEVSFAQDTKPGDSSGQLIAAISKTVDSATSQNNNNSNCRQKSELSEKESSQQQLVINETEGLRRPEVAAAAAQNSSDISDSRNMGDDGDDQVSPKHKQEVALDHQQGSSTSGGGGKSTNSAEAEVSSSSSSKPISSRKLPHKQDSAPKQVAAPGIGGHQHHQHSGQHQHSHSHSHSSHHHHHHHPHQHGHHHHHHHHHHRQCPHHKHHQSHSTLSSSAAAAISGTSTGTGGNDHSKQPQLTIPTESVLTTTMAASAGLVPALAVSGSVESAATSNNSSGRKQEAPSAQRRVQLVCSKKRSVGSVDQFMRAPTVGGGPMGGARRKSECNRMLSMVEATSGEGELSADKKAASNDAVAAAYDDDEDNVIGNNGTAKKNSGNKIVEVRPASACCSYTSTLDNSNSSKVEPLDQQQQQPQHKVANQRSTSNQSSGQQQAASASVTKHQQQQQPQQMLRKSSLNIMRTSPLVVVGVGAGNNDKLLLGGQQATSGLRKSSIHQIVVANNNNNNSSGGKLQQQQQQQQHSPLKVTKSVCAGSSSSSELLSSMELGSHNRQNIGDLERELEALKVRLDRRIGGVKMSKVTQSYLSYFKQWAEYDPFIAQPIPSNPWISDSTELWDSERQTKDVHCRRVRRWAFSLKELLNDPAGREQFHRFLEKEFSAENLKFWDAVQELKRVHSRDVARRVEAIWTEYLAQDANCPINIDSKSYETSKKNMAKNKNNRCIFDEAAGHVYQLMKNDSYPRYLRSDMYKDYKEISEKKRSNQVAFDVFKPQITTLKHKFNF